MKYVLLTSELIERCLQSGS